MIAGGAPFTHMIFSPLGDSTTAVTFFDTGSKGVKLTILKEVSIAFVLGYLLSDCRKALSMASRPFFFRDAAKQATSINSQGSIPSTVYGSSNDNLFLVKVPVLIAAVSIASRFEDALDLAGNRIPQE